MQRVVDEAEYVLAVLHRMRDEVSENPDLFDPDAQRRMEEEIARLEHVVRSARSQLTNRTVEQNVKAA
jgi:hypothetical protein